MERVEMDKEKRRKSLILKALNRCRTFRNNRKVENWRLAPEGCFSVYIGPGKERFVVRTERVNQPLFRVLLKEAELEYGYGREGPLELPCSVELFHRVLEEMEQEAVGSLGCNFARLLGCSFIGGPEWWRSRTEFC